MKSFHWTTCYFMLIIFCSAYVELSKGYVSFKDTNEMNDKSDCVLSPIIIIPGFGGSKMQAKLNKASAPHWWCSKKTSDYFNVWLGYHPILSFDCWVDNVKLIYNRVTRKTRNTPGVHTRVLGWGTVESMEWIWIFGAYFNHIAEALIERGYIRGENLFGAPYDFRKAPNENTQWFENIKQLSEYAYGMNKNTPITFIAYSMGGRMLLHFLQQMPQTWKNQYVKRVITLGVPYAGSVRALQAMSIGYDLGIVVLPNEKLKEISTTFPSLAYLMPSQPFWEPNEPIVIINRKSYSVDNIHQFFYDIGMPQVAEMRKDQYYNNFTAPGVELHCLYGINLQTLDRLYFETEFNSKPEFIYGNGDGQVNKRSLLACKQWENTKDQAGHKIYYKEFNYINHLEILYHSGTIKYILKTINCNENYSNK